MLSVWTPDYSGLASIVLPNREEYCRAHGYELHTFEADKPTDCSGYWLPFIALDGLLPHFNVIAVLDIDMVITNRDVSLLPFVRTPVVAGSDIHGFNSGFTVWRPEAMPMLKRVLASRKHFDGYPSPDQVALAHMLICEPGKVSIRQQRECNSYLYAEYGLVYPTGEHQPGDFVIHFPGLSMARRIELAREYVARAA